MGQLYAISYSPWSEKARWALDHHKIDYREITYLPLVSEPMVRLRLKKPLGRVTVPIYFGADLPLTDSFDIARYAEAEGKASRLFPPGRGAEIGRWNDLSERAMAAGRALATLRVADHPEAAREGLPVPAFLQPYLGPLAGAGVQYLVRKYRLTELTDDEHRDQIRMALGAVRSELAQTGTKYLLGDEFSYADIAMAAAAQLVSPVADRYIRLAPGVRECMHDTQLNDEFADIFAWRDWLYDHHREQKRH